MLQGISRCSSGFQRGYEGVLSGFIDFRKNRGFLGVSEAFFIDSREFKGGSSRLWGLNRCQVNFERILRDFRDVSGSLKGEILRSVAGSQVCFI